MKSFINLIISFSLQVSPSVFPHLCRSKWQARAIQYGMVNDCKPRRDDVSERQGAISIRKTVLPGMAIPMLKIRRPNGRLIFNMEIAIRR